MDYYLSLATEWMEDHVVGIYVATAVGISAVALFLLITLFKKPQSCKN
jgi:hypothetical protein